MVLVSVLDQLANVLKFGLAVPDGAFMRIGQVLQIQRGVVRLIRFFFRCRVFVSRLSPGLSAPVDPTADFSAGPGPHRRCG